MAKYQQSSDHQNLWGLSATTIFSDSSQLIFHNLVQHKAQKKREKKPPTALIHSVLERSQKWIRDVHEK